MKAVLALTSRYNVILVNQKGGDKMDKEINIKIKNGKLFASSSTDADYSNTENTYTNTNKIDLLEIAIVIECLKKEQEKIMNKQKDKVNKFGVGIGKMAFTAIQLPEDSPLSLVIRLLNDMHMNIERDDCNEFWKQYKVTLNSVEI